MLVEFSFHCHNPRWLKAVQKSETMVLNILTGSAMTAWETQWMAILLAKSPLEQFVYSGEVMTYHYSSNVKQGIYRTPKFYSNIWFNSICFFVSYRILVFQGCSFT